LLYNLPAVLGAVDRGEPVYIAEGELCVHALRAGLTELDGRFDSATKGEDAAAETTADGCRLPFQPMTQALARVESTPDWIW
jgi:hypothetical protein